MDFITVIADILNLGVCSLLLLIQGLIWVGTSVGGVILFLLACCPAVFILKSAVPGVKRQPREAVTSQRLTALTVSISGSVIPAVPAATGTDRDQRILVVAAYSVTVGGWDPDNNPGAAAVPAAMSGATGRATGRHLPASSGDRGPGIGPHAPRPPTVAAWLLVGRSACPSILRGNCRHRHCRRMVWSAHGMGDDPEPPGFVYWFGPVCEPLLF